MKQQEVQMLIFKASRNNISILMDHMTTYI